MTRLGPQIRRAEVAAAGQRARAALLTNCPTSGWGETAIGFDTAAFRFQTHLDRVTAEKDLLGRELLRCHEQLSLVFEIAEHIASLHDPS